MTPEQRKDMLKQFDLPKVKRDTFVSPSFWFLCILYHWSSSGDRGSYHLCRKRGVSTGSPQAS